MHPNAALLNTFYEAFANRDAEAMAACYHADITFKDPVFPDLRGPQVSAMWTMLCTRGKDLKITHRDASADDDSGKAHWDATYTFSGTGRLVNNSIDARFTFADGLIVTHEDYFDLFAWTRMALGPTGWFLGWTPMVQGKVRSQAADALGKFIEKHPS